MPSLTAPSVESLVIENLPLVGHLAREASARLPRHLDADDLAGAGSLALVQAARSFDASLGVPFAAFATTRIRGAMIDHMRARDWASRTVRSRARALAQVSEQLTAGLRRHPNDSELATASGLSVADVRQVRQGADRSIVLSLDPVAAEADGLAATLADPAPAPDEALVAAERIGYLRDALAELPQRQRLVVTGYYLNQRPLLELADELGVTQSRASQLRSEGLEMLRDALDALLGENAKAGPGASTHAPANPVEGVKARRRQAYVDAVANRSTMRDRADVKAYLAGGELVPLTGRTAL